MKRFLIRWLLGLPMSLIVALIMLIRLQPKAAWTVLEMWWRNQPWDPS